MIREGRESGSKPSSGKHSTSGSIIHKVSKEELSVRAPFSEPTSLEQLMIFRTLRLDGKPLSGNDSSIEQPCMHKLLRDGSSICMLPGNDSNLRQ